MKNKTLDIKPFSLYSSGLNFEVVYMGKICPSLENRVQKFRHAFCHKATVRRIVFKAEFIFGLNSLMEKIYFLNKPEFSNTVGITCRA